ncbi:MULTISPECIES: hypothetical protein [unclassified Rothia (in: high G+C Gram-positive bacteria)]|uniref:hypothetical protein n=1 Tax=unclassified Rothia (in: high G+C Gram-positive bacteria) TaxID=2689056 RepID=UPI00195BA0BA|nr:MULTISPECIES: hypothetical protein [unclassified Rothia (in: high G+C Gram-positive bacteria)]MBM7051037.1 hypothetical protein [Rothia sp. ZJ1223]QRZ62258.1 hypothetical protein JR346_03890 [Rothia sp. ZJ932]
MKFLMMIQTLLTALQLRVSPSDDSERGDVPGWVMITMMTAILVAALLVVAQDALVNMFQNAMSKISG